MWGEADPYSNVDLESEHEMENDAATTRGSVGPTRINAPGLPSRIGKRVYPGADLPDETAPKRRRSDDVVPKIEEQTAIPSRRDTSNSRAPKMLHTSTPSASQASSDSSEEISDDDEGTRKDCIAGHNLISDLELRDKMMEQIRRALGPEDLSSALDHIPSYLTRLRAEYEAAESDNARLVVLRRDRVFLFRASMRLLQVRGYVTRHPDVGRG